MALYCRKKKIALKRNSVKTPIQFLLLKFSSFFQNRKLSQDTKILEFNQYQISDKTPFVIYADPQYLIGKTDGCKTKINEQNKIK